MCAEQFCLQCSLYMVYGVCNTIECNNNSKYTTEHWTVEQHSNGFSFGFRSIRDSFATDCLAGAPSQTPNSVF